MNRNTILKMLGLLVIALMTLGAVAFAQTTYYVNNQTGQDGFNGLQPTPAGDGINGPKLTISNAIGAAVNGDIISVANTGVAYGDLNVSGKTLTFTSTGGSPTVANITIDAATTFTGSFTLAGTGTLTLTSGAVTNANNITIGSGATIARAAGTLDVAPAFAGTVNLTYSGANKTIGPEFPTASTVLVDLNVNGALTVTVNRAAQMSGQLTVNNASGVLALGSNTLTITNTTATKTHNIVGSVTATSAGGLVLSTTSGNVTFTGGGTLPSLTTSGTTGTIDVNGPVSIVGSVTVNSGSVTLTTPTGVNGLTGNLTNNGSGTVSVSAALTIGGNVSNTANGNITFGNVNVTINGNVSNTGALSNTATGTGTQISNVANITFGTGAVTIGGNVTNSVSFAGSTSGTGATTGGFANSGNITFGATTNDITITGLTTNAAASTFATTATTPAAGVFSGNGRITFASTIGNVTFTGGLTNSSTGFGLLGSGATVPPTVANGSIVFSGRTSGTVTVGTGSANANITNNSTNTGAGADGVDMGAIDLKATATGAVTVNGNVVLGAGTGQGDIILGGGTTTVTGSVSNLRSSTSTLNLSVIAFNATTNSVTVGSLSQTGGSNGRITFASTTGSITVSTGGSVTVSSGEILANSLTTGAITINGSYTQSGGTFSANAVTTSTFSVSGNFSITGGTFNHGGTSDGGGNISVSGDLSITGGTITLGNGTKNFYVTGASTTITGGTITGSGTTLVFNRAISAQTLTSAAGVVWPGHLNINNTFPSAPTWTLLSGNFVVAGDVTFSAGGATNGVNLPDFSLFVRGNFVNNSGYTTGANAFVTMQGTAAQTVDGIASFANIALDNSSSATPAVTFTEGNNTASRTYTFTGIFHLTNGEVAVGGAGGGSPDVLVFNNTTTPPTIVRNAGSFETNSTPNWAAGSDVSVTYIGGSKTFSNEVPPAAANKLFNLTIATTGTSTVTANINFAFKGTLTINSGQTLAIGSNVVTANGPAIVSNGSWTATTGYINLNRAGGTTITATGALPEIRVAANSVGNSISGSTGITVGSTPNLTLPNGQASISLSFTGAGTHVTDIVTANADNTITLASNVIASGNLTHAAGTIALGSNNLTIRGTAPSITQGATFTSTGGRLIFNASAHQTLTVNTGATTIGVDVEMNQDASTTQLNIASNNLTLSGNVTLTRGVFRLNGANVTLTGTALTLTANSSIAAAGAEVLTFDPASGGTNTVTLAGNTSLPATTINGNVTLAGAAGTLTLASLTHSGGTLNFADRDLTVTGAYVRNATTAAYSATTGILRLEGTITQGTGLTIPNLEIGGTSRSFVNDQTISVTRQLILNMDAGATLDITPVTTTVRLAVADGGTIVITQGSFDTSPILGANVNYVFRGGRSVAALDWPTATTAQSLTLDAGTLTITSTSFAGGTVTVTTSAPHGLKTGATVTISGNSTAAFNGTYTVTATPSNTTFQVTFGSDPEDDGIVTRHLTFGANRAVAGTLTLTNGVLDLGTGSRTLTLSDGATVNRSSGGSVSLGSGGVLAFAGVYDLNYVGTAALTTGPELSTSATALRNLTFTRTGNVSNFTVTNARNITVNGTLAIRNNLTTTGTITALGNVTIETDAFTNATSPTTTFTGALTFGGAAAQTFSLNGNRTVTNMTINKTSLAGTVTISGGDLTVSNNLTFTQGLLVTGTNNLILSNNPGFTRTSGHVVGNVRRAIAAASAGIGRYDFPVGSLNPEYRPFTIVFPSNVITAADITVSHVDQNPLGVVGLPVLDPSTNKRIGGYPDFYWLVRSSISMGASQAFDVELVGTKIGRPFVTVDDLRIIRRFDGDATVNPWSIQGSGQNYSNILQVSGGDSIVTVRNVSSTGGLVTQGARFTIGIPTRPPSFTVTQATATVNENSQLSLQYTAVPNDVGETVTYSLATSPAISTNPPVINATTGLVTWTPNYAQAGTYTFTVTANDGEFNTTTTTTVTVVNVNRKPTFTAIPEQTVTDGQTLSLTLAATDPDGDPLTYSFVSITPSTGAAASVNPTVTAAGALSWSPAFADAGRSWTIRVAVTDNVTTGAGELPGRDSLNISVNVNRSVRRGDANLNGEITISDASRVLEYVVGLYTPPAADLPRFNYAADANANGIISALDASRILLFLTSPDSFPLPSTAMASNGVSREGYFLKAAAGSLQLGQIEAARAADAIKIPMLLSSDAKDVYSVEFSMPLGSGVEVKAVTTNLPDGWLSVHSVSDGVLKVALAGPTAIGGRELATVTIGLKDKESRYTPTVVARLNDNPEQSLMASALRAIPTEFALQQNYPNPFNPSTTIKYQLAEGANVVLEIYNLAGQKVRTLVNEQQEAGYYSVVWDGLNDRGERLASGMYFYRINAGKFAQVNKMVMLK